MRRVVCYIGKTPLRNAEKAMEKTKMYNLNLRKMNKQQFKKAAEEVGASMCNEMMSVYYNVEGVDREKISMAVAKVLGATGAAKANANRFFDRGVKGFASIEEYKQAKGEFFKKLFEKIRKDFNEEISAALKLFNEAVPQSVKDANKVTA